jgi:hypothetical protein
MLLTGQVPKEKDPHWIFIPLAFLALLAPIIIIHNKFKHVVARKKALLSEFMSDFTQIERPPELDDLIAPAMLLSPPAPELMTSRFMVFGTTDDNEPYDRVDTYDFIERNVAGVRIWIFELSGQILESSITSASGLSHRLECSQKILWLHSMNLQLPNFSIRSRRSVDWKRRKDLVEISNMEFSKYYVVYGKAEEAIRRACGVDMIATLLRARIDDAFIPCRYPEVCIDGDGQDMLLFWQNKSEYEPEELRPFVELGLFLCRISMSDHGENVSTIRQQGASLDGDSAALHPRH